MGDIITDEAGEAVGIVVRKKAGDVPGLMMSLKEFKIGNIFKVENVIPDLINSKDGEINTKRFWKNTVVLSLPSYMMP